MIEFSVKNIITPFRANLFALLAATFLGGCTANDEIPVLRSSVRDEPVEIQMRSGEKRSPAAVLFDLKQQVELLTPLFDPFSERSEISTINQTAGISRVPISYNTYRLLEHVIRFSKLSEGAFDVTTTPVSELWGFEGGLAPSKPLNPGILQAALRGVGVDQILLNESSIRLTSPFTKLDVYDLVAPFSVDLAVIQERKHDVSDFLIRYKQSVRALGSPTMEKAWSYPVKHPVTQKVLGDVVLANLPAMSWSVLSDESVVIDGEVYRNQIDPRTGMPVESILMAVAVCKSATKAHALSRALLVLDKDDMQPVVERFQESAALVIPNKKPLEIWVIEAGQSVFRIAEPYGSAVEALGR